ncbi:MAG: hypothetical protein KF773_05625 [Deltaproteobacteria bacterium]|nr:hypothetical protein [Deltaproteobacteria bacterium]MCW5801961.1 hypothetical protein [Deltaproteobacteria bacterium]
MIVLSGLGALSALAVVSVRGGMTAQTGDRFHVLATYAAESGGAAAMDFLRKNVNMATGWSAFVSPSNKSPQQPSGIPGNNAQPGDPRNILSEDTVGWYSVAILNNRSDSGFAAGTDNDARVIVRSTGYGPNGAVAVIEWEISASTVSAGRPCPGYATEAMGEDGAGRNDCMGTVNFSDVGAMRPGG